MTRTAVAAPDAFEDLFEFIDTMTIREVLQLANALHRMKIFLFGDGIERDYGGILPTDYRWPDPP